MGIQDFFFTVVHKHLDKVIVQEFGAAMGRVFALVGAISITLRAIALKTYTND